MRKGDTGANVRELQHRLAAAGFEVEKDGWFGERTEAAVVAFQQRAGLVADGIAGPKTLAVLETGSRPARLLGQADIDRAAEALGVAIAAVMAVNEVESLGRGFLPDGRPAILFERHVMHRLLADAGRDADALAAQYPNVVNAKRGGYAGGAAEHARLATACGIDLTCALQSASWGQYQIMGFHWQTCGYDGVEAFVEAMRGGEAAHLDAFVRFIAADPALHKALKGRKWAEFAKLYNGPAYRENLYDQRLARAYARYSGAGAAAEEQA
jgi:hypothetical protein